SEAFETHQSNLLFSKQSGLRDGDLTGNLISIFLCLKHSTLNEFKNNLHLYSASESLKIYNEHPTTTKSWDDIQIKNPLLNKKIGELIDFFEIFNKKNENCSRVINQVQSFYIE